MIPLPPDLSHVTLRVSPAPRGARTTWTATFGDGDGEPFAQGSGYGPRTDAPDWCGWLRLRFRLGRGRGRRLRWSAAEVTHAPDGRVVVRVPVI